MLYIMTIPEKYLWGYYMKMRNGVNLTEEEKKVRDKFIIQKPDKEKSIGELMLEQYNEAQELVNRLRKD